MFPTYKEFEDVFTTITSDNKIMVIDTQIHKVYTFANTINITKCPT